jgi:methylated-DNA-[protein]-cysteine S-methyltransferase
MINTDIKLAVLGYARECTKKNAHTAALVGKKSGRLGFTLVAANVIGTFAHAFEGAKEFNTASICVIEKFRSHPKKHNATEIYHVKDTFAKHSQIASMSDAAILIGGGSGSQLLLDHFLKNKKTVIAINGSGGLADSCKSKRVFKVKTVSEAFKLLHQTKKALKMPSPLGTIEIKYNHFALTNVRILKERDIEDEAYKKDDFAKQITKYFNGKPYEFTGKIHLTGSRFQKTVWLALLDIPWGKTIEFGEMAIYLNMNKKDGNIISKASYDNPIQIIVPDHRLITKDGSLSKFKGGAELKIRLLDLERRQINLNLY